MRIERIASERFVATQVPPVTIPRPPLVMFTPPGAGFITTGPISGYMDQ